MLIFIDKNLKFITFENWEEIIKESGLAPALKKHSLDYSSTYEYKCLKNFRPTNSEEKLWLEEALMIGDFLITQTNYFISLNSFFNKEFKKEFIENTTNDEPSANVLLRRKNCSACEMLKQGVKFRISPTHTCGL